MYSSKGSTTIVSSFGSKSMLPEGTTRTDNEVSEEVVIPPPNQIPPKIGERLVPVSELDDLCKPSFPVRLVRNVALADSTNFRRPLGILNAQ